MKKKRSLPAITFPLRAGVSFEIPDSIQKQWNPYLAAASDSDADNTISIFGEIGEGFLGEGVTARRIAAALRSIGKKPVVVNINSPGGSFFEGVAIYNLLREHPEHVTMNIIGMGASAAAVIPMAGDDIRISRLGAMVIHKVSVVALVAGNSDDLQKFHDDLPDAIDFLKSRDEAMADLFSARTGINAGEIMEMLAKETRMGGEKAVELGFADSLLPSDAAMESPTEQARAAYENLTLRKLEAILARAGMPRKERRELLNAIPNVAGAMRDAGPTAMRDAGEKDAAHIQTLLAHLRAV